MSRITLVLGANGQLGSELKAIYQSYDDINFYFAGRDEIDISNPDLLSLLDYHRPDVVINCAAYTAVDKAEEEMEKARLINGYAVRTLAKAVDAVGATLIHISTDYAYHVNKRGPLLEEDPTSPKGIYAKSKVEGEQYIATLCPRHIIIRTSWLYSSFGHNFVKTMIHLGTTRDQLSVVNDQWGAPTYARDLAEAICTICRQVMNNNSPDYYGLYNYANEGITSWQDFAKAVCELTNTSMEIQPISTKEYNAASPRPRWSKMSTRKIKKQFGLHIPHWLDGLKRMLELVG